MKFSNLITIILFTAGCCSFESAAQSLLDSKPHAEIHKQLLANAKSSKLDKSVIKDFIKNDIEKREDSNIKNTSESTETITLINDLLKEANTHIGKRYRSGAKGPNAFDCSGFSSYVFRQFGYNLGASSRDQYNQGSVVEKQDLKKGDLVFFTGRNSRHGRVGHVGIVVSVDSEKGSFKFIHASTSQGIQIDTNDAYYGRRYLGARRIINNNETL